MPLALCAIKTSGKEAEMTFFLGGGGKLCRIRFGFWDKQPVKLGGRYI